MESPLGSISSGSVHHQCLVPCVGDLYCMFQCEFYAYKLADSLFETKPRRLPAQYPEGLRFKDTIARIALATMGKDSLMFHLRVQEYTRECRFIATQARTTSLAHSPPLSPSTCNTHFMAKPTRNPMPPAAETLNQPVLRFLGRMKFALGRNSSVKILVLW